MKRRAVALVLAVTAGAVAASSANAQDTESAAVARPSARSPRVDDDLTRLTLEQLMDIEVTSASRKREALARSPAALYVVTREDIRRSGVTSLAEVLRQVPGLQVARINSNQWAISARGFNGRFANKLLILVDGRTVYTPLFSGVYWEELDMPLPDVERIEVIRGPGAALWGANAVNGVINILTRPASETLGGLAVAAAGNEERALGTLRYGGALGTAAHYRVFAEYVDRDDAVDHGVPAGDDWRLAHAGLRADAHRGGDALTVQAGVETGRIHNRLVIPSLLPPTSAVVRDRGRVDGAWGLVRWTRTFASKSELKVQLYYDATHRDSFIYEERRGTADFDLQHQFHWGARQEVVWGAGYRSSRDTLDGSFALSFTPRRRDLRLASAFVQDEIEVRRDFRIRAGLRLEHHEFTGLEVQPTLRAVYTPHPQYAFWAAVSRALRTPSRAEEDVRVNLAVRDGALLAGFGNRDLQSETLFGLELGYRQQATARAAFDAAAFWNDYADLRTAEPGLPFLESEPAPAHLVVPVRADNRLAGHTYGFELSGDWAMAPRLKLRAGYSFLRMHLEGQQSSDSTLSSAEGHVPRHQVQLRASYDLGRACQLDAAAYGVDRLADPQFAVPRYVRVDARVAWVPSPALTFSANVQNALQAAHREFGPSTFVSPAEIQRSFFGLVIVRF
jgi:iron complex outermembrane receptor protein